MEPPGALLGPMLAVPHAAFAIGLVFLLSPSGWLLRVLSPRATGLTAPPPWVTTQDPWALGLILALVAKEVPFLLWAAASQLQRTEVAQRWTRELQLASSMGYTPRRACWRVLWPQMWPRLQWPMLACTASLGLVLVRCRQWRPRWTTGERGTPGTGHTARSGPLALWLLLLLYLLVMLALAVGSVSGVWPFPAVLPDNYILGAWISVWGSASSVGTTLSLGLASSTAALAWSIAWLEAAPPHWDAALRRLVYLPPLIPSVLWVVGLHATTLALGIDGRRVGLWLAHGLACTPYVLIALRA